MVRKSSTFAFGSITNLKPHDILTTINDLMTDVLDLTKTDLKSKIEIIPKDTGLMRSTVLSNIDKSNYAVYNLNIFFGANELEYTKYVEKMSTMGNPHVRHPPHNDLRSIMRGLQDPKAEGHPFAYMAKWAKFRVSYNWSKAKLMRGGAVF